MSALPRSFRIKPRAPVLEHQYSKQSAQYKRPLPLGEGRGEGTVTDVSAILPAWRQRQPTSGGISRHTEGLPVSAVLQGGRPLRQQWHRRVKSRPGSGGGAGLQAAGGRLVINPEMSRRPAASGALRR